MKFQLYKNASLKIYVILWRRYISVCQRDGPRDKRTVPTKDRAAMLEHFINVHKLTGENKYLDAAYEAAETLIGESTVKGKLRNWYTAWNRHEPETSDPYQVLFV